MFKTDRQINIRRGVRRPGVTLLILIVLLVLALQLSTSLAASHDIVVNSADDADDGVCDVTHCSLREAIDEANALPGLDTIAFSILGAGPHTIQPTSALPTITDPVTIDGYTQPGASPNTNATSLGLNTVLKIELDGSLTGDDGLSFTAGPSAVRGLAINSFDGAGIVLQTVDGSVIEGNFVGTDVTGTAALGNRDGILIRLGASNNTIGGTTPGDRNLISANRERGVFIVKGSTGNFVLGNYIGTDVTGGAALGNVISGVGIERGAQWNTVGGTTAGARNIISGNDNTGVSIGEANTTNNEVLGNYIGTDATGTVAVGNRFGVFISEGARNNTIGGTAAGSGNLIAGNDDDAVVIQDLGTAHNVVAGNFIGTDAAGTASLANSGNGVLIAGGASGNLIGGVEDAARNLISGNSANGVAIFNPGTTDNAVQGNFIGTDVTGTASLGNAAPGIAIGDHAANNVIGGTEAGAGNLISGNMSTGITIGTDVDPGATGNLVQGNYIGTDVTGSFALGNSNNGVNICCDATDNTIGGTGPGARNIISANGNNGVKIRGAGTADNVVSGNYIGTDVTGTVARGNAGAGVAIDDGARANTVGGTTAGERNVISGNGEDGVQLRPGTELNVVSGNFIGTDVDGTVALGNNVGVRIEDASDNTIGGLTAGARNLISGNFSHGIRIAREGATGNVVQGNYIGTDATGTMDLGNAGNGVAFRRGASNNTIGGAVVAARNIISGNDENGVAMRNGGTSGNVVAGNYIGTDLTGTEPLGNLLDGVRLHRGASDNLIGGSVAGERNIISANGDSGVLIAGPGTNDNRVSGNYIGTDVTGAADLGNGVSGVAIEDGAQLNTVGGTSAGEGNIIAGNHGPGVRIGTGLYMLGDFVVEDGGFELRMDEREYWGYGAFERIPSSTVAPEIVIGPIEAGDTISFGRCRQSAGRSTFPHHMTLAALGIDHNLDESTGGGPVGDRDDPDNNCEFIFTAPGVYIIDDSTDPGEHGVAKIIVEADDVLNDPTTYVLREFVVEDSKFELRMDETAYWGYDAFQRIQSSPPPEIVMGPIQVGGTISFDRCRQSSARSTVTHHMTVEALSIDHNLDDGRFGSDPPGGPIGDSEDPNNNCEFTFDAPGEYVIDDSTDPGEHGVARFIVDANFASPSRNAILGNSIFSNDDLGIDLEGDGVTPNDPGDVDTGGNNLQNFPELMFARRADGMVIIHGDLNSAPNTTFRLEFFANASCGPSGHGEGEAYIGFDEFTTNAVGQAVFTAVLPGPLPAGQFITATATDSDGNTSEFSACVAAIGLGHPAQAGAGGPSEGTIPVPTGIVSWWPGDGNADDIIDGNHGTLTGGAKFAPGLVGEAFSLDGVDDYVDVGTSTTLAPGLFTIELWMHPSSVVDSGPATLASRWGHSTVDPNSWILDIQTDQRICITASNVSGQQQAVCSGTDRTSHPINTWHHVTATYNGNTLALYLDGELSAQASFSGTIQTNPSTTSIGCKFADGQCLFPFPGLIDDVALFDRALTADEIKAIYDAGSAGKRKAPPEAIEPPQHLVGWWSGDAHADDIKRDNDGTFNGIYELGKVDLGFSLDGTDDLVLVPDSPELNITGDVTVDLWARRTTFGSASILRKGADRIGTTRSPTAYRLFFTSQGWLIGGFHRADGSGVPLIGPSVTDSDFHHYAYVRSGNTHKLFIDGRVVASGTFTGSPGDTSGLPLTIGARRDDREPSGFRRHFGGTIDEVEIFNRALRDAEIKAIYDAGSAGKIKPAGRDILNVYDDFDDNTIDPLRWTSILEGTGPTVAETNQRLEITHPADATGGIFLTGFSSVCLLRGDFDVQVDFDLLIWPTGNGVRMGLIVTNGRNSNVERSSNPDSDVYLTNFDDGVQGITPTTDLSGKLRMTRSGSNLTGSFFNNSTQTWIPIHTFDAATTRDVQFHLWSWSHDRIFANMEVEVAFDNVIVNQGQLICNF